MLLLLTSLSVAHATWSLVVVDEATREVGVASATCLTGVDLAVLTPVMVVGRGAAAAQSSVDALGNNRATLFAGLGAGAPPEAILARLADEDLNHQRRQYGIADVPANDEVTFTGSLAGAWAGGVVGQVGTLRYAIQGNVLTGAPVVAEAERAFVDTPGDLPTRLMAGMEAAAAMGGDGRCSCSVAAPESCGSPPADFEKSADVAYLIVSRLGDVDGTCDRTDGCATGDYYMRLNVADQQRVDPDPVFQLRDLFDAHRDAHRGRPDHIASTVDVVAVPGTVFRAPYRAITVTVRDWTGARAPAGGASVRVRVLGSSSAVPPVGPVVDNGDGTYTFDVGRAPTAGTARLRIQVDDGGGPVTLSPLTELTFR